MSRTGRWLLVNLAAFQIVWWSAVLGAAHGLPWAGPLTALGACALHVRRIAPETRSAELTMLAYALCFGLACDATLMAFGLIRYAPGLGIGPDRLAPAWMAALWPTFATTLNHSLGWLRRHPLCAALFGALAGPLAYGGGVVLGAAGWPRGALAGMTAIAALWAVTLPLLSTLSAVTVIPAEPEPSPEPVRPLAGSL